MFIHLIRDQSTYQIIYEFKSIPPSHVTHTRPYLHYLTFHFIFSFSSFDLNEKGDCGKVEDESGYDGKLIQI